LKLTSALEVYIILSMAYITMEWRGQQHAWEAVESTVSGATAAIQLHHHLQAGSDEEEHGRLHTGVAN